MSDVIGRGVIEVSADSSKLTAGINTAKNYLVAQGRRAPTSTEFDSEEAETFDDGEQLRDKPHGTS